MALTFGTGPHSPHPGGQFNFEHSGPDTVLYWEPFPKRVRVEFNRATVADSQGMRALHETGRLMVLYFPRDDVDESLLEPNDHTTESSSKGTARYWTVRVGDQLAENAVWAYPAPPSGAPPIAGYVAFRYSAMDAWYQEDERVYAHPRDPYHRVDVGASQRADRCAHGVGTLQLSRGSGGSPSDSGQFAGLRGPHQQHSRRGSRGRPRGAS